MTKPSCDGVGIVLLFSAVISGLNQSQIEQSLNDFPDSSFLLADLLVGRGDRRVRANGRRRLLVRRP